MSDGAKDIIAILAACGMVIGLLAWLARGDVPPRQYETTLGDGRKATCIIVTGYRSAALSCVPHEERR